MVDCLHVKQTGAAQGANTIPMTMATKRSYDDGCAAAHALDLIGERWALLIVRELLLGPKRFTALRAGLPSISPNVLTQRLNELDTAQVLQRRKLPPPASAWVYELTDWGKALEPIVLQLAHWGVRSPAFQRGAPLGVDALMLSFKAMFNPAAASHGNIHLTIELHFGDEVFSARVDGKQLHINRGQAVKPAAILSADPQTLLYLAYGKFDIDETVQTGRFSYTGERSALVSFFSVFALPEPAAQQAAGATSRLTHP
ncbi:winged helix-turn-helix transcriptional regulator [Pusillimonas sp. SM2304]|uniref:winged helix-turn-helix transcriptional regulator n=1 Tax=Pusillimonas sp. SM2304 TaxID=3073241 RepID=UPI002875CBB7|nr:winged helix-turn-helix transcriptional regulator [Pusillimonas sp. SM2304]MDS1141362.1 winged helix-turn-helix transcriptional regulator [Pusillimonas sp. SM2304]